MRFNRSRLAGQRKLPVRDWCSTGSSRWQIKNWSQLMVKCVPASCRNLFYRRPKRKPTKASTVPSIMAT